MDVATLLDDLAAEHAALDQVLEQLDDAAWRTPTASPGWSVADQVAHLGYFDRTAVLAITEPEAFAESFEALWATAGDGAAAVDALTLGWAAELTPAELHASWRNGASGLVVAGRELDAARRLPWYGPPMSAMSFLTARLMETWAHGQDVVDATGVGRAPSDRLGHIARLGMITRGWSYANRGLDVPDAEVRVELVAPSGAGVEHGPEGVDDVVSGPMEDFCLVVTQRRHVEDTQLVVRGDAATEWMALAQVFAGPATNGPAPRSA